MKGAACSNENTKLRNTEILCIALTVEHNYNSLSIVGNTTTCFGPRGGPSSGCNLDLEISYTRCVGGRDLVISILCAMA